MDTYLNRSPAWWEQHMAMVLDGVTLTMAPRPLSKRQKHAAQRITSLWMRAGETLDNDLHTCNRYGVQFGTKVALWGDFAGNGYFTLRLWTPKPKMTKDDRAACVPSVKAAVDAAGAGQDGSPSFPWVWHDNERFLQCPAIYRRHGLLLHRSPANSGDLKPIEKVWAWLRKDLPVRKLQDLKQGRQLTPAPFKQRCAQILNSYSQAPEGHVHNRLQKLVCGMPKRLRRCKRNRYGRCGK